MPPTIAELAAEILALKAELSNLRGEFEKYKGTWLKLADALEKYGPKVEKLIGKLGLDPKSGAEETGADPSKPAKKNRFGW